MKKFFSLVLIFLSLNVWGQINYDFTPQDWGKFKTFGNSACGVGSIHVWIGRSPMPNQLGYYAYEIYFATNSYLPDCRPSNSYVPNIEIMSWDAGTKRYYYPLGYFKFWVVVGQTQLVYTIYHQNPNLIIKIKTGKIQPSTI